MGLRNLYSSFVASSLCLIVLSYSAIMTFVASSLCLIILSLSAIMNCGCAQHHTGEDMHNVHQNRRAMQPFMYHGVAEAQLLYSSKYCTMLTPACQQHMSNMLLVPCNGGRCSAAAVPASLPKESSNSSQSHTTHIMYSPANVTRSTQGKLRLSYKADFCRADTAHASYLASF